MQRYLVQLAYDGSVFHGWQRQKNAYTVQESLENALTKIAKKEIKITGSGRTDTGVHATCQYAHFDFPIDIPEERFVMALITALDTHSVRPLKFWKVPANFNARFNAYERTYNYILTTKKNPFNVKYKSFLPHHKLDLDLISSALPLFLGTHDFDAFSKPNPQIENTICNLKRLDIQVKDNDFIFTISANRFLHNMVRRIIGCLATISHHQMNPEIITDFLNGKKANQKVMFTAPPNGLYLTNVNYTDLDLVPESISLFK